MRVLQILCPYAVLLACFVVTAAFSRRDFRNSGVAIDDPAAASVEPHILLQMMSTKTCQVVGRVEDFAVRGAGALLFSAGPSYLLFKAWARGGVSFQDLDRDGDGRVSLAEVCVSSKITTIPGQTICSAALESFHRTNSREAFVELRTLSRSRLAVKKIGCV